MNPQCPHYIKKKKKEESLQAHSFGGETGREIPGPIAASLDKLVNFRHSVPGLKSTRWREIDQGMGHPSLAFWPPCTHACTHIHTPLYVPPNIRPQVWPEDGRKPPRQLLEVTKEENKYLWGPSLGEET